MTYQESIKQSFTAEECKNELKQHANNKAEAAQLWREFTQDHGVKNNYLASTLLAWLGYKV